MGISAKKILSTKIAFFALLVLLALAANGKYKQYKNQKAIDKEKESLVRQTRQMESNNAQLKNSLPLFDTSSYKELVAKRDLNLKKSDEIVFGFSNPSQAMPDASAESIKNNKPNAQKWLEYFTGR